MSDKKRSILNRIALLVVLAMIVSLISSCGQKEEPAATSAVTPEVTAQAPVSEEPVSEEPAAEMTVAPPESSDGTDSKEDDSDSDALLLVTVNGEPIDTYNEYLNNIISYYLDYADYYGYDVASQDMIDTINQYSLQYTIRSVILQQKAKELGLDVITDEDKAKMEADARAEWVEILDNYAEGSGTITESSTEDEKAAARADAAAAIKESDNYDEERYVKESLENGIENLLTERVTDHLTEGKTVSEEDVRNYFNDLVSDDEENYKDNIEMYEYYTQYYGQESYYIPEGYRAVNHILLSVDEELLNNWKDLNARLEEQKSGEEAEPTDEEDPEDDDEDGEDSEETPAPEAENSADPAAESPAEPTEEPTATPEPTPTPEPVTQEMVDAAEKAILESVQSTVDEINAKLEAGTSFDELIKEYGTDPGMQDEASRANGYNVHEDSILWDPIFTSAAMALEKIGDVSKPVVTQFGVHILHYLKDVPSGPVELTDEMKAEFSATLLEEMRDEALSTALDQWEAEAELVYTEAGEAWKVPEDEDEDDEEDAGEAEDEDESLTVELTAEDEQPAEEKPAEEKPAEEKSSEEQPAEEKPAEQQPAEEKPAD